MTSGKDSKGSSTPQTKEQPKAMPMGGSASFESKMMRSMLESTPTTEGQIDLSDLPDIPYPKVEGIEVRVPEPPIVTNQDVDMAFQTLYFQCLGRDVRKAGETVQMGDEVLIDMVGFIEGIILPFSAQEDLVMHATPNALMPGFAEGLVGAVVGDTKMITVQMPQEDIMHGTRYLTAAFAVHVKGAAALTYPAPDSPEVLQKLGLGNSLEEVRKVLAEQLTKERANAMVMQGFNMVLDKLLKQVKTPVPPKLIDEEIRFWWRKKEGEFLQKRGISRQDMDVALKGWQSNDNLRKDATRRLKVAMLFKAYNQENPPDIDTEELRGFIEELATSTGADPRAMFDAIAADKNEQNDLAEKYLYLRTMVEITANATIHYGSE